VGRVHPNNLSITCLIPNNSEGDEGYRGGGGGGGELRGTLKVISVSSPVLEGLRGKKWGGGGGGRNEKSDKGGKQMSQTLAEGTPALVLKDDCEARGGNEKRERESAKKAMSKRANGTRGSAGKKQQGERQGCWPKLF